ncbi:MAG: DUF4150 domain-containing protein [Deltaproteobacteria bacterium]|nr:DUF4150 domain-containing protein [Deltaproteobacteria bacterium]
MAAIFPALTNGGGQCMAVPDVCLTPAPPPVGQVPIPYPNNGMMNQAQKTSRKVKIVMREVVTLKSEIPRSSGDEAGTGKGVISGMNMDKVIFKIGSSAVKVEGQPCVYVGSMTGQNGINANAPAGAVVASSQTKVIIAP